MDKPLLAPRRVCRTKEARIEQRSTYLPRHLILASSRVASIEFQHSFHQLCLRSGFRPREAERQDDIDNDVPRPPLPYQGMLPFRRRSSGTHSEASLQSIYASGGLL